MTLTVSKQYYFGCANMGTVSKFSLQTKDVFIAYVIRNMFVAYSGENPLVWEWGKSRKREQTVYCETNLTSAQ